MSGEDQKRKIIEEYIKSASPDDIKELNKLLEFHKDKNMNMIKNGRLNMDVKRMAKDMSRRINEQLGMANIDIRKMAEDLVIQMAIQHKPDITDNELLELVKVMVPDSNTGGLSKKIPADILKNMIVQFITYAAGAMSEKEQTELPEGWAKKYWNVFSPGIRDLIKMYLKNGIDNKDFWAAVEMIHKRDMRV